MLTDNIADIPDPYPSRTRRVCTSLALRPEHHLALARLALDLGIDRASLMRRALVVAGVIPAADEAAIINSEAAGE